MKSQTMLPQQKTADDTTKSMAVMKSKQLTHLPQLAKKHDGNFVQEVFDTILWRIDAKCLANETMAVGLTGCLRKSGASTIAANLAVRASAQHRGRVLLIDANWELPGLLKTFNLTPGPGLYDILSGEVSQRECEPQPVAENLDVLSRGKLEEYQPMHVQRDLVEEMLSDFKTEYSLILVDLPAAQEMRSALPLARHLDGSLLVARFEAVKHPQAMRALQRLQEDGLAVWGTILNRHREYVPRCLRNWL